MERRFPSKLQAREWVWNTLSERKQAAFPFPPTGRIPNFKGARQAAERLFHLPLWEGVRRIKVNPDSPQKYVRELALRRGIVVFVPTPRLKAGFLRLDPQTIPEAEKGRAASIKGASPWAREIPLAEMPQPDLIITGSVAVTPSGKRCGKGHGYGDLEFAILRELGHRPVPVLTTVHELQVVDDFPGDAHDLPVSCIVTPERTLAVERPPEPPAGVDWSRLTEADLREMPVLAELRKLHSSRRLF